MKATFSVRARSVEPPACQRRRKWLVLWSVVSPIESVIYLQQQLHAQSKVGVITGASQHLLERARVLVAQLTSTYAAGTPSTLAPAGRLD